MKQIFTSLRMLGAIALLALAAGCASTQSTENMLVAAGFKVITPKTAAQQQKLKALPPDKVTGSEKREDLLRLPGRPQQPSLRRWSKAVPSIPPAPSAEANGRREG